MPTGNSRIQVMLDKDTNNLLSSLAHQHNQSLSSKAADLIREALELHEDSLLSHHGDNRFHHCKKWIHHQDAWNNSGD